jgi:hypothetical protein
MISVYGQMVLLKKLENFLTLLKEFSVVVLKACDTLCLSLQLCNGMYVYIEMHSQQNIKLCNDMYVTFHHSGNVI